MLFDDIVDRRVDGTDTMQQYAFIISNNGGKRRRETTKGWEIIIQWKDGSTKWESMKYLFEFYPFKQSEYYHQIRSSQEPEFAWWIPHFTKKRNQIISKVKSRHWTCTQKYGVRITKSVKEAIEPYKENVNTL